MMLHNDGLRSEQIRVFSACMLNAAERARAMRAWVLGDGINAPASVRSAVWSGIFDQASSAADYLNLLGGLAGEW